MATPRDIIEIVRCSFGCQFDDSQILDIINSLEKKLNIDIVRNTEILENSVKKESMACDLEFPAVYILKVFFNGRQVFKSDAPDKNGYRIENNKLILNLPSEDGKIQIEKLAMPENFSTEDCNLRSLLLSQEYNEIYIYHILTREALMYNDFDRVNNFSLLYAEALRALKERYSSVVCSSACYRNIW